MKVMQTEESTKIEIRDIYFKDLQEILDNYLMVLELSNAVK